MCSNETHTNLTRPEHFMRHSMQVEQACALTRRNIGSVSVEQAMKDAAEALALADPDVAQECTRMLRLVLEGDLRTAAQTQYA